MERSLLTRRRFAGSTLAAGSMITLSWNVASAQATPEAGTFPVTIEHAYGSTTIASQPQRVVTIGWSTQDACIALGVIPVGIQKLEWSDGEDGILAWTDEALGDATRPAVIDADNGVPFEQVLAVNPDVILAPFSGITDLEYDLLSQIAPTVAYPDTAWSNTWQEVTRTTGDALGLPAAAEKVIADTDDLIASRVAEHPAIVGKSYIFAAGDTDGVNFTIFTRTDGRPKFLESLGLVPSEFVERLVPVEGYSYLSSLSVERANEMIADVVVFSFPTQEDYDFAAGQSYFQAIPAWNEGRVVAVIGQELNMALTAWSSLSIAWALDAFIPLLATAAEAAS